MNRTILSAEDNDNDRAFLHSALRRVGLDEDLKMVKDGQEALDYLQGVGSFADRDAFPLPGLVLLSPNLPYVPGLDVLKWIREQPELDRTVVILLSASSHADIDKAYGLRVNSFLVKPGRIEGWNRIARAVKEYWFGLNRAPRFERMPERQLQAG